MPAPTLQRPTRDAVTTIRADGSRPFMFPAEPRGRFTRKRRASALLLIAVYLLLPWVRINGYPAVFFDLVELRFHLFGLTLAAQDMWLLFFVITGVGFSLFFVTALLGRVWCGWACPQTVFLDHVYRRIEVWIDGDSVQRRMLHAAPFSVAKASKRIVKHTLYALVSAAIMHLFLAYFVSLPEVWSMITAAPVQHWGAFAFMGISTAILYFNYAWFREQMCIVLCPYGRMQSALIDDDTMVIGYDARRGDPPSPRLQRTGPRSPEQLGLSAEALAKAGDCVDCARCVHVCPTGIDIRHGLQMECIGCTACIDACDDVMTRLGRPRGLIRYDSQAGFAHRRTRWLRPRTIMYFVLLVVGAAVATWAASTVRPAALGVTRMTGAPYIVDSATVRNQFLVRIVNKRNAPARFAVQLDRAPRGARQVGLDSVVEVGPMAEIVQPLIVQLARREYSGPFEFKIRVADVAGTFHLERAVEFLGPEARLLREEEQERR